MQYGFRQATEHDLGAIQVIVRQAQEYLRAAGIPQWQNGYPNKAVLLQDILAGVSWVLESAGGEVSGTVALIKGEEPTYKKIYDGEWLTPNKPYATIHRIALHERVKGSGAGEAFYSYIETHCAKLCAHSIRVDTHRKNLTMQGFLAKCGFLPCGVIYLEDGAERLAFEKLLK